MEIIILSVTRYKEKDAIINGLSKDGCISLTAKGILDPKNKNNELNNILNIVDVDFVEGDYKYPLIKRHKVLFSTIQNDYDYYYLTTMMLLSEATEKLLSEEDRSQLFDDIVNAAKSLNSGTNYLKVALIYLAKIIKISGYELEINHCVYCGKKENIVAFSFVDGGFICKNCANEFTQNDLNSNQLLLLRASFMAKSYDLPDKLFNKDDALYLLNKYSEFIFDGIGYKLNTVDMLNK